MWEPESITDASELVSDWFTAVTELHPYTKSVGRCVYEKQPQGFLKKLLKCILPLRDTMRNLCTCIESSKPNNVKREKISSEIFFKRKLKTNNISRARKVRETNVTCCNITYHIVS